MHRMQHKRTPEASVHLQNNNISFVRRHRMRETTTTILHKTNVNFRREKNALPTLIQQCSSWRRLNACHWHQFVVHAAMHYFRNCIICELSDEWLMFERIIVESTQTLNDTRRRSINLFTLDPLSIRSMVSLVLYSVFFSKFILQLNLVHRNCYCYPESVT